MTLTAAVARLVEVGGRAGLPAQVVQEEGERLAAAVCESVPGAPQLWSTVFSRSGQSPEAFFEAASSARRWRNAPTVCLAQLISSRHELSSQYGEALAQVVEAACELGTPGPHVRTQAQLTTLIFRNAHQPSAGPDATGTAVTGTVALPGLGSVQTPSLDLPFTPGTAPPADIAAWLQGFAPSQQQGVDAASPAASSGAATGEPQAQTSTAESSETAAAELPAARPLEELLAELDALIGLDRVKQEIHRQTALLRVEQLRRDAGLTTPTLTRHLVFVGNPGTGKTTVARLVSQIYRSLGLLSQGHLVEVDRSGLVAGYVGQTGIKTAEAVTKALNGVLFIDEAYALTGSGIAPDQFGMEAVNTLVKGMEDHRDELVVIVAGYPVPMEEFIAANPGLESRFATTIIFEDYEAPELRQIFEKMAAAADFIPTSSCLTRFEYLVQIQERDQGFGNARWVRNVLDGAVARHAWRLRETTDPTVEQLQTLLPEDLAETTDTVPWPPDDVVAIADNVEAEDSNESDEEQTEDVSTVSAEICEAESSETALPTSADQALSNNQVNPLDGEPQ